MRGVAMALAGVFAVLVLTGEAPAQAPVFEAVSIKSNTASSTPASTVGFAGGRYTLVNGTAAQLIRSAYPAPINDLVGAPAWVTSDRFDVTAVASGNPPRDALVPMLRAMLADRFKLIARYDIQERDTYSLVLARPDGRLGPDIRLSTIDCDAVSAANLAGRPVEGARPANGAPPCGLSAGGGILRIGGMPMAAVARTLAGAAGRVIVDKTGLTGAYELTLRYAGQAVNGTERPSEELPSIFTAVQEQLGLKLEADRAPLQLVVIDRIERPTED
jgi:uncharacterized protein (TIGR03435 family)